MFDIKTTSRSVQYSNTHQDVWADDRGNVWVMKVARPYGQGNTIRLLDRRVAAHLIVADAWSGGNTHRTRRIHRTYHANGDVTDNRPVNLTTKRPVGDLQRRAILLLEQGHTIEDIADALVLDPEQVRRLQATMITSQQP